MREHILKTWSNAWDAVKRGDKRFEWRKDDRGFEVGDVLVLREWNPAKQKFVMTIPKGKMPHEAATEHNDLRMVVTYILRGSFNVPENYCVMSIAPEEK